MRDLISWLLHLRKPPILANPPENDGAPEHEPQPVRTWKDPKDHNRAAPIWCVVGNIVLERPYGPGGQEIRSGTRQFRPGAKVVCTLFHWDSTRTHVQVVGRHRGSNRYITCYIRAEWLTNVRAELIRSPAILKRINESYDKAWGEEGTAVRFGMDGSEKNRRKVEKIVNEWLPNTFGDKRQPLVSTRTSKHGK